MLKLKEKARAERPLVGAVGAVRRSALEIRALVVEHPVQILRLSHQFTPPPTACACGAKPLGSAKEPDLPPGSAKAHNFLP